MLNTTYILVLLVLYWTNITHSIFLPYFSKRNHTENSFHIAFDSLEMDARTRPGLGSTSKIPMFRNVTNLHSLDDRCQCGLPLSIAWHNYPPYTMIFSSKHPERKTTGLTIEGMFPSILSQVISFCCHNKSDVHFGKFLKSSRHGIEDMEKNKYDLTFPLYSHNMDTFRNHAIIPIVKAPRVILLVHDESSASRTHILFTTIINAWPMLIFIIITALLSGIIIWFLDHGVNPVEFPTPFLRGAWEGFWWALVTMTTVGYGDRSPKAALARIFCIIWIFTGVIIISIFTALVTASLSASTYPNFNVHGSVIGAINGSEEFKLGVTMNAEMRVFPHVTKMTQALLSGEIDGALVDNYVISHSLKLIKNVPIRVEKYIDHEISYGVGLASNSSQLERCMRYFIRNYPQELFEIIANKLQPLRNPTDDVSQQLKAAEGLFYEEGIFKKIMFTGIGIVLTLTVAGLVWEFAYRRPKIRNHGIKFKASAADTEEEIKLQPTDDSLQSQIDNMISEYELFHEKWLDNLKLLRSLKNLREKHAKSDANSNANLG